MDTAAVFFFLFIFFHYDKVTFFPLHARKSEFHMCTELSNVWKRECETSRELNNQHVAVVFHTWTSYIHIVFTGITKHGTWNLLLHI